MSYREKIAWLSLVAMAASYGPYFAYVAWTQPGPEVPNLPLLGLFALATAVRLVILGPGWLALRFRTPSEDRVLDERDRDIDRRAVGAGYGVLMTGAILTAIIQPFTTWGWDIVNSALFAIVVGEAVRYGLIVWGYRRRS